MTDPFEEERLQNRTTTSETIAQELRQFKKLQHLSDHEVAHRMATSLNAVRELRKARNQLERNLREVGIAYEVRVILGAQGIKTTGALFRCSDPELLLISRIGRARLTHIREKLREFFA